MDLIHHGSGRSKKGRHLTVSRVVRLTVVGLADDKIRLLVTNAVPAGSRLVTLAESQFKAKAGHDWLIKTKRAIEVRDTDEDVGKNGCI